MTQRGRVMYSTMSTTRLLPCTAQEEVHHEDLLASCTRMQSFSLFLSISYLMMSLPGLSRHHGCYLALCMKNGGNSCHQMLLTTSECTSNQLNASRKHCSQCNCQNRGGGGKSCSFIFSTLARPNMLSLERFQSCFNS